jgi:hypothetical protein
MTDDEFITVLIRLLAVAFAAYLIGYVIGRISSEP